MTKKLKKERQSLDELLKSTTSVINELKEERILGFKNKVQRILNSATSEFNEASI